VSFPERHLCVHSAFCRQDLLYAILYGDNDEDLLGVVKGLIDPITSPKPGQLAYIFQNLEWSLELREAMDLLRTFHTHDLLKQDQYRGLRRTVYHAIIFACLPHVPSFTQYVVDRCSSPDLAKKFMQEVLVPSENTFFYYGQAPLIDVSCWCNHLRARYAWYLPPLALPGGGPG